jgi:hypothetical protein
LCSLSSDDSAIYRTRRRLCSQCTDYIEKLEQLLARSPGRLQEAVFSKDPFGLGGGVVTRDEHVTTEIECGSVFVNDIVRSDPRLPSARRRWRSRRKPRPGRGPCARLVNFSSARSRPPGAVFYQLPALIAGRAAGSFGANGSGLTESDTLLKSSGFEATWACRLAPPAEAVGPLLF